MKIDNRRLLCCARIAGTVMAALAWDVGSAACQDTAPTPAVQVRVTTVTAFTVPLAGQRVRVVDGIVEDIVSPRVFVVSGAGPGAGFSSNRVAVLVGTGNAAISSGQRVIVTGVVRGFVTRDEEIGSGFAGTLTADERNALANRPLIIASSTASLAQP